jgi:cell division protease FtsH
VAEALFVGDISVGASNDIDRATKLAKDMVARYGMCEKLGTVSYLDGGEVFIGRDYQTTKSYSEKVAATIDDEVRILIDKAYAHCKQILSDNAEKLNELTEYLLEHESISGEQFNGLPNGLICLKGGELEQEAKPFGKAAQISSLSEYFEEEFFETKKVVYLPL